MTAAHIDPLRRTLLKGAGATGALAAALAAGLLRPTRAWAASEWNKAAFGAADLPSALKGMGVNNPAESRDLVIKAPDIAENGAVVPVEITSNIANTQSVSIYVEKNPLPLAAHFDFANGAMPTIAVRLKMAQTSNVKVVARADGKFYTVQREIKVTVGGCGG